MVYIIMRNLVFFGDSHTARSGFGETFRSNYRTHMKAESGIGSSKIIENIYEFINNDIEDLQFKKSETLLIIEYSYLSRLYLPRKVKNQKDFNGQFHSPTFKSYSGVSLEMDEHSLTFFYNYFLLNFYDEETYFNKFLMDVSLMNAYLEKNEIGYINYLWDITAIIEAGDFEKHQINSNKLRELNFIEFEKESFLFGRIAERDKLRIVDETREKDEHLTKKGYEFLKSYLDSEIESYNR